MPREEKKLVIDLLSPSEAVLSKEQISAKKKREEDDRKAAEGKQRVDYRMKYPR